LETLLTLKSAVGKMLCSPPQISLKSALSLITLGMHTLSFSLFNSRILQIPQTLPPLIIRSGNVPPHNRSILTSFPLSLLVVYCKPRSHEGSDYNLSGFNNFSFSIS
jgi:hypothetical protein